MNFTKNVITLLVISNIGFTFFSCSPKYILDKNGEPIKILVIVDKNYEGLNKAHKFNRDFLASFIQDDLKRKFKKENLLAVPSDSSKMQINENLNHYILVVKIDRYKAKKSTHGMGPGILYLNYSLKYENNLLINDSKLNISSVMGGTYCAKRLNETIVKDVSNQINKGLVP